MLHLVFRLDGSRYAVDATHVSEVLPLVRITPLPRAPLGVAGLIEVRGMPVPAIDLTALMLGRAAEPRLSTRLIVVRYPARSGEPRPLALIAERVTETLQRAPAAFVDSGVGNPGAAYLGPVTSDVHGLVQRIEIPRLLPPAVSDVLFT